MIALSWGFAKAPPRADMKGAVGAAFNLSGPINLPWFWTRQVENFGFPLDSDKVVARVQRVNLIIMPR